MSSDQGGSACPQGDGSGPMATRWGQRVPPACLIRFLLRAFFSRSRRRPAPLCESRMLSGLAQTLQNYGATSVVWPNYLTKICLDIGRSDLMS